MPVIIPLPQEPTDLVVQGAQLRAAALGVPVGAEMGTQVILAAGEVSALVIPLVAGAQDTIGMIADGRRAHARLQSQENGGQVRANALVATPCGALVWIQLGRHPCLDIFVEASSQWLLSGITRDNVGVALGDCQVAILETGRIAVDGAPVVAQTVSDGAGNYSVAVPTNTAFQAIAYKAGTPDVAGISRNDLVPAANG